MPGEYIIVEAEQELYCNLSIWTSFLKLLIIVSCLQENTVVQTCVVACYSLAFAGGFGCYLLSMDHQTFDNLGPIAGNRPQVIASTVKPLQRIQALAKAYNQWLYTLESKGQAKQLAHKILMHSNSNYC